MKIFNKIKWLLYYPIFFKFNKNKKQEKLIEKYGGNLLNKAELLKNKKSDKIFILGTGQSINNLTEAEWLEIRNNDSFGINDFCHKNFAPTFYSFELERQNREDHLNRWKKNSQIILDNFQEFNKTVFCVRPYDTENLLIKSFLNKLNSNNTLYWQQIDFLPGKNSKELENYMKYYNSLKMFERNDYFPSRGSSLSWILGLVYKLGYKEVILCGIDLYGEHFTTNVEPLYETNFSNLSLHETAEKNNQIGILEIINSYVNIYKTKNIKLSVSTKYSLLSKSINIHFKNL